jgi:hypothetical protein
LDPLERWFSEGTDARSDVAIAEQIGEFIATIRMARRARNVRSGPIETVGRVNCCGERRRATGIRHLGVAVT